MFWIVKCHIEIKLLSFFDNQKKWESIKLSFLKEIITEFKANGIRTAIFVNPEVKIIEGAKLCGTDRIELYTEDYASRYSVDKKQAISPYLAAAEKALEYDLKINAGHDLNLTNLGFFVDNINPVSEVSIGHALISDAIYLGLENTIQMYREEVQEVQYNTIQYKCIERSPDSRRILSFVSKQ